ncbi:hypothetical protein [Sunxiuqinia rutila]|uniref:hypothetical protein n=1 Tax=Sunxiuqinia rutila TaxID=1397841 RepID=UPI003D36D2CB
MNNSYQYLPEEYHLKHDYCEFVVSQIEDLILNERFIELKSNSFEFPPDIMKEIEKEDIHILDILEKHNYSDVTFHIVKKALLNSLIMETCYFLQESLQCSLKMRMTVCFTLLRKPFLEILIIFMRILNEDDFITNFNEKDGFDPIRTSPEKKKELIEKTNNQLFDKYPTDDIFDYIFAKDFGDSLFNVTNNSIHLFTNRNPVSATEKQNLNFIFSQQEEINYQWEYIYDVLPMLLTFIADLTDLLVLKSTSLKEDIFLDRIKERDKLKEKNNVC